jgi:predicted Fe-Mo cluster-binding NifX family protein
MKIAVASQNFRTITPHAGRSRKFLIYEAAEGGEPAEVDRLDLPKEMSFHEFHEDGPHPLDAADVLIVGSCGARFVERLASRGITAVATAETDPVKAVKDYLAGTLSAGLPHEHGPGEGHHHDHGHGHEHGHGHRHSHARCGCHHHDA